MFCKPSNNDLWQLNKMHTGKINQYWDYHKKKKAHPLYIEVCLGYDFRRNRQAAEHSGSQQRQQWSHSSWGEGSVVMMEQSVDEDLLLKFCWRPLYIVQSEITFSLSPSQPAHTYTHTHTNPAAGMGSNTRRSRKNTGFSFTATRWAFSPARAESNVRGWQQAGEAQ